MNMFFRSLALGALAVVLAWQVVATNLAVHLAEFHPEFARILSPENPDILAELADRKIRDRGEGRSVIEANARGGGEGSMSPLAIDEKDRRLARAWARTAVVQAPLDARAFRILGQLATDEMSATKFMEAAARRSLNETLAHYWLLRRRFERKDYVSAMRSADILLRSRPQLVGFVAPYLARMAEDRDASKTLDRALAGDPPWRERFLDELPKFVADVRAPLRVMLNLKKSASPASEASRRAYFLFLLRRQAYDFAYFAWRRLLDENSSRAIDGLYNADFLLSPSGAPFDWVITSASGAAIEIVPHPDDSRRRALMLEFGPGRAAPHGVTEYVKLEAGAYRMSGRYKGELDGRRGVRWRVACVGGGRDVGESEMASGRISSWKRFEFDFVVPEVDCPLVSVGSALDARSPSEWIASGRLWYSDLRLTPVAAEATPSR